MIYSWGAMVFALYRKKIENSKWTLRLLVISVLFPYISNQAGWCTAEAGRQPWVVYNLLRTAKGVSQSISAAQVMGSLIMFVVIYSLFFSLFIFLLNRKIQGGPLESHEFSADEYRAHL